MKEFYLGVSTGVDCIMHVTHVQSVYRVFCERTGVCEYMRPMCHSWRSKTLITNKAKGWRSGDGAHTGSGCYNRRSPSPSASWDVCEHKRTPDERLKVNQSSPTSAAVYYLLPGVRVWSFEKMPLTCLGKSCNGMSPAGAEEWNSRRSQAATFLPRRQQAPALNFKPLTGC